MSHKVSPLRVYPGRLWRALRVVTQLFAVFALIVGPLLGGWQRNDAEGLSAWTHPGWDLPAVVADHIGPTSTGEILHQRNPLKGGGTGAVYVGVPMVDPVTGAAAAVHTAWSPKVFIAFFLPLLVALLLGRVFCGWFCPFGALARLMAAVLVRIPGLNARYELGPRRPLRWALLVGAIALSALGSQTLITLALPHLMLKQSLYSLWLMGGGGAVLGWLGGLVVVSVIFGPTTYCAALCPTGAMLSLLGRFRPVRLRIEHPEACGKHCHSCDLGCWLSLHPSTGDAGPDCDNCGRCLLVCPHDNLRVGYGRGQKKSLPVLAAVLLGALASSPGEAQTTRVRPSLLVDEHRDVDGVNIALGVLDLREVRLDADAEQKVGGVEISLRLARGERGPEDALKRQGAREHYAGPLKVQLQRGGQVIGEANWDKPNSPRSTVNRKVYRERLPIALMTSDVVVVEPVEGWIRDPVVFTLVEPQTGKGAGGGWFFLAGLLVNGGLLAMALALSGKRELAPPPS